MKTDEELIAYLATLAALVVVFLASLIAAAIGNLTSLEALGVGTITGGLIGVLNKPQRREVKIQNDEDEPVPVKDRP